MGNQGRGSSPSAYEYHLVAVQFIFGHQGFDDRNDLVRGFVQDTAGGFLP